MKNILSYTLAEQQAAMLHKALGVKQNQARCTIVRHDGRTRGGYRVTVTRYEDTMSISKFVHDNGRIV